MNLIIPSYPIFAMTYQEQLKARGITWCALNYSIPSEAQRVTFESKWRRWVGICNKAPERMTTWEKQ